MTTIEHIRQLLPDLNSADKAQVLRWIAQDLSGAFPGIETTSGVAGGDPCIVRTRIPVWLLVQARSLGASEADLLRSYPTLTAEDLTNAWAYYRAHKAEIGTDIRKRGSIAHGCVLRRRELSTSRRRRIAPDGA